MTVLLESVNAPIVTEGTGTLNLKWLASCTEPWRFVTVPMTGSVAVPEKDSPASLSVTRAGQREASDRHARQPGAHAIVRRVEDEPRERDVRPRQRQAGGRAGELDAQVVERDDRAGQGEGEARPRVPRISSLACAIRATAAMWGAGDPIAPPTTCSDASMPCRRNEQLSALSLAIRRSSAPVHSAGVTWTISSLLP